MWRALQLAKNGEGRVSPNPMVGAVIVHGGKIIGEGFHAKFGDPHAEVNAINSVSKSERSLLRKSTMYVTLEPCAHYGKTPPCAELIVKTGIPRVVIACLDPNPLVAGKGIKILEDAGIEVKTGVLENESKELNRRFLKAQTTPHPWIILKWAQSSDGFMASIKKSGQPKSVKFSTPVTSIWMHRERAKIDAITVGAHTEKLDSPKLNVRDWGGNSPKKISCDSAIDCKSFVKKLRSEGISSLMIEGGPTILRSFIEEDLFDEIRVEISPIRLHYGLYTPGLPNNIHLHHSEASDGNMIFYYRR